MKYLTHSDLIKKIKTSIITILYENSYQGGVDPTQFIEFDTEDECFNFYYEHFNRFITEYINNKDFAYPRKDKNLVIFLEGGDVEINITFQTSKQADKFYQDLINKIKKL